MKKTFFAFLLCSLQVVHAQEFGGNPSYLQWRQVNTDVVRVIYPVGFDSIAQRVATITDYLQKHYSETIGGRLRKISIILQTNTSVTNGYVALAPYRSEFYLMPPQDAFELGAQNWADNLSIHEFRHVQQYSNFDRGWSKVLSYILGEQGEDLANSTAIPNWFFEGDAVYNETMLSHQGRGRLPSFLALYRSIYDLNKHYTYMQLRNGSYQHQMPDHYPLGYMLVSYGREKYGIDFWRKVTADASAFHPLIYPLQNNIEKYAGISFKQFASDAFRFFHNQWDVDTLEKPTLNWVSPVAKNNVIDYKYPYRMEDGSLVLLKDTYTDVSQFVIKHQQGNEEFLRFRDIAYDDYYSYNNGKIVYGALKADARWGYKDYSVIKLYDIKTGTTKTINHKTKYFSPDVSHNGKLIASINMLPGLKSTIVLLDVSTGKVLQEWGEKKAGIIYSYPKFSSSDKFIYVLVRNNTGYMGIEKRDIAGGKITVLVQPRNTILGFPVVQGDTLLYSCSSEGYDETWAYIESQHKEFRLARFSTGLYQAVVNNNQLYASAFTADGYRLGIFKPIWQQPQLADTLKDLYVKLPFNPASNNLLVSLKDSAYPVKKYPKSYNLVNFHSYRPFYNYPNTSLTFYGQNVLYTLQSELYYTHNINENYNQFGYSGVYGGTYLEPILNISQTFNRREALNADTIVNWNEFNVAGGLQLPLNFTEGLQYRTLTLASTYNYDHIEWTGIAKNILLPYGFSYLQNNITYVSQAQQGNKQIYPSWAQVVSLQYRSSISQLTAHQFLGSGSFYMPGFGKTNSTVIDLAYQFRDVANQYFYTNDFPISRGYSEIDYPRMWKAGINYHFPICYPEWGFANIGYVERIRANLFFDYTGVKSLATGNIYNFNSFGAEFYLDGGIWNQVPATIGVRVSHLLNGQGNVIQLIIPNLITN